MFVIYKTNAKAERKEHAMVNIRKLNNLVISDAYSLSLQSDIIVSMKGYINLAVLDAALFWFLYPDHQYMFTVITY